MAKGRSPSPSIGWAHMLRDVLVASINKGQLPLALPGLLLGLAILKMPGEEVAKFIFELKADLIKGWIVGWVLAPVVALGWYFHAKSQRRRFAREFDRVTHRRDDLQKERGQKVKSSRKRE